MWIFGRSHSESSTPFHHLEENPAVSYDRRYNDRQDFIQLPELAAQREKEERMLAEIDKNLARARAYLASAARDKDKQ